VKHAVWSATLVGIEATLVEVEGDISGGLPTFQTVGLAEAAVREARVRVQAAIGNAGIPFPAGRISVNLAPAHVRKDNAGLDLPIALAILAADGRVAWERLKDTIVLGELSLSGEVRPVKGALAAMEAARAVGLTRALVAPENGPEAALASSMEVRTVRTLDDALRFLVTGDETRARLAEPHAAVSSSLNMPDLSDVRGQEGARRALEIAAAGAHNILFVGGPGAGKTMLARRLPSILPPLSDDESIAITRIHSAAGLTIGGGLVRQRPFRAPHHSTTAPGLVGGGAGVPRPGEITLAHHGVLFLDELPEFVRGTLEALRQPLESDEVMLSRAHATVRYPARVIVVGAMNPCPCGYAGSTRRPCRCFVTDVARYRARISGPLLDRMDLLIDVPPVDLVALDRGAAGESSAVVRARVERARVHQRVRQGGVVNARLTGAQLIAHARPDDTGRALLLRAVESMALSARGYERVLRVARTIADLDDNERVRTPHIAEALSLRVESQLARAA
jgi:magnesium chelatase family protein